MQQFFTPKSVAVIGASRNPKKVGRVIFDNVRARFKAYPVNTKEKKISGVRAYTSVLDIPGQVDLAVIAIPSTFVLGVVDECGRKGIKHVIVISSGFKEIGNDRLEHELGKILDTYGMKCIGPNCLGIFDAHSQLDTLFLPTTRLTRPKAGVISFISQSGAAGSAILDLLGYEHFGFAKFISFGNGTNVTETDLLEYLGRDKQTRIICMYIEGLSNGKRFLSVAKKIDKPIIVIKGGRTEHGQRATLSHTGSLAGSYEIYKGAFRQAGVIVTESLREMFDVAKLFEKLPQAKGKRVQVITNGGGYGILATDSLEEQGLPLAQLSDATHAYLSGKFPKIVSINNPMDLVGDATNERYDTALEACMKDSNVDALLVILLYQTPLIDDKIIDVIKKYKPKKPMVVVMTGGKQTSLVREKLETAGFPVFTFPSDAAAALKKYFAYRK